jgi:2,4-dienoyl-CoA reductase (NADPH2)
MARVAAAAAGRERFALIVDWLEAECRRLGVAIELGAPGPGEVAGEDVIWAVGGVDAPPAYSVDAGAVVHTAAEYLGGVPLPPDGPVVVWDPIGGPIGVSVAETLLTAGHAVTLVTPDMIVGTMLSLSGDLAPANVRLQAAGAQLVRRTTVVGVGPGRVEVEERFSGARSSIPAVALVDAGHRLPSAAALAGASGPRIGDCVAPRTVHDAILDARRAVLALEARSPAPALAVRP